ncbi:MAG: type IX secretion system membrane protein PorP/SprF [Cyclobacteriaceae bacterium]|nr:type IX secretion system membrane protein PorP/SprF [Cyclobacteriaceae bacterium]UYN85677.1 MAG: type IX secretion system membrane protein PorP/SprF [Cyclobacteriaceae bacterium]
MRLIFSTLVIGLVSLVSLQAQDIQFSQYYQAPLYLNPGFAGITPQQRVAINHRVQWPNLPQAFATYAVSYDIFVDELRSGFGFLATTDKMGSAGWRTTTAGLLYSYKVKLTDNWVFSPGLYFGYGTNGIDRSRLRLGDGLEFERDGQYYSIDPDQDRIGRQSYFDFGSGALLYSRSFWIGTAFHHMNQPNLSVLGDVSRLPMKGTVHTGLRINLSDGTFRSSSYRISYLTPSIMYRWQGKSFSQLDAGLNYHIDPVSVGIWYRGKPWEKNVSNNISSDALIIQLGLYMKNLNIGYSYDFTVSELQTTSGGAHEISLVYQFSTKPVQRSVKQKYRLIPCPTFNSKEGFWN